jgi:hypothetical protein
MTQSAWPDIQKKRHETPQKNNKFVTSQDSDTDKFVKSDSDTDTRNIKVVTSQDSDTDTQYMAFHYNKSLPTP